MIKKIYKKIILIVAVMLLIIPVKVIAATVWTGKDYLATDGVIWGLNENQIAKVESPGRVYSLDDIDSYSAYFTNGTVYVGKRIENSFAWCNRSRLGYVKLFKVKGGQDVSFLFNQSICLYCAEYDSSFTLIDDGRWGTNGTRYKLKDNTEWIIVVFRIDNGELQDGAGLETVITSSYIKNYVHKYIIFEPFKYTLNMNGGKYMGSSSTVSIERLGVEPITLPEPQREGYKFAGWKTSTGKLFKGTLTNTYEADLFKDTSLTAEWTEIKAESVTLDMNYVIFEQNSGENATVHANIYPQNVPDKRITFTSSDNDVASVDSSGKITPGKTGIATITASTANGKKATCKVYVMGFEISVPTYCTLNQIYEIDINIYNNGEKGMTGRKQVILDSDDSVELVRIGDDKTKYLAFAESRTEYETNFKNNKGTYFAKTEDSEKLFYRLMPNQEIKKAGDYEGNVTFTVSVRS